MKQQADLKNVTIGFKPLPFEIFLKMDLMRTQQIVINFLSNAIKFSPEKSEIETQILLKQNYKSMEYNAEVSVRDSGIGMTDEDKTHIF